MNNRQRKIRTYMMLDAQASSFDFLYKTDNEEIDLIYYYGNSKNVKIPNNYESIPITTIDPSCFAANKNIKNATIAEGIEAIY